jgi:hypothetical protein
MSDPGRMLLFIDVDGVLLGKRRPRDIQLCLADGCERFIDFALDRFDCHWLTSHCRGDAGRVIDYLRPYATPRLLDKLRLIQPTGYKTFKTEALHGDFLWIDDAPTAWEIHVMEETGVLHRWLQIDTRQDHGALVGLIPDLQSILDDGFDQS